MTGKPLAFTAALSAMVGAFLCCGVSQAQDTIKDKASKGPQSSPQMSRARRLEPDCPAKSLILCRSIADSKDSLTHTERYSDQEASEAIQNPFSRLAGYIADKIPAGDIGSVKFRFKIILE